ncbi:translocation/assembly module TamB domain-containing protein [Telluribacter sp. SYSU D00476]|uniref:translocation/assembly module TamB domain-containing protein n=1 Tax=Telluribacter sp. SYSU D00476 TaxID=2811430 RepID=UPI001FF66621|nr:translocation/assembly module TamB domain-containing protein [Telluribacter sp. SYSU D00476]
MINILRSVVNGLVVVMIFALLALEAVTVAFQFPAVQTWAVDKAARKVSEVMGYPISIRELHIKWFDVVSLGGVSIRDAQDRHMIRVERIDVNLSISQIIENRKSDIHLDEVTLFQPDVHLIKNPANGDLNIDDFIARINELTTSGDTTNYIPNQNIPFTIGKAHLVEGTFKYDDPREPRIKTSTVFDYNHFELGKLNASLDDFLLVGDTIRFQANDLTTIDTQTKLKVHDLDTRFLYCVKRMELAGLSAYVGRSYLTNYISFNYDSPADLGYFNSRVRMIGHLDNSRVHSNDLGLFAEYLLTLDEIWKVSGDFDGIVNNFRVRNTDLRFGKDSRIVGDLAFKGLPEIEGMSMNFRLDRSQIHTPDLVQYYPETDLHQTFQKFGMVHMAGTFKGTFEDFNLKGHLDTDIGSLTPDLEFHIDDAHNTTYNGQLATSGLDLGVLLDQPERWQKLDMSGSINGRGFDLASSSANLNATISRLGFDNYDYRAIRVRGNLQKAYFNGQVSTRDTNLVVNLDGEFDLSGAKNAFDIQGVIEKANLFALGYAQDPFTLGTQLDVQVVGNSVDELTGRARFLNTHLLTPSNERNLVIDTLQLTSVQEGDQRTMELESEFMSAWVRGNFVLTPAVEDLNRVLKEYQLYFFRDEMDRKEYYEQKTNHVVNHRYEINYEVRTRDLSQVLAFLYPDAYVSPGAHAEGEFRMDNTALLTLNARADTVRVSGNQFVQSEVDITTSKFVNSEEVLASAYVTSAKHKISLLAPTERLEVEATWDEDHISFRTGLRQVNSSNRANLSGELRFLTDGFDVRLQNSRLNLLDEVWQVTPNNLISITGPRVRFSGLALVNDRQRLALNGTYAQDSDQSLLLEARNFKLATLNQVFDTKLGGVMDGTARLRNVQDFNELKAEFNVEGLSYDKYELGNFEGVGDWDEMTDQFYVDAHLEKNARRTFSLTGSYNPKLKENPLNMKARFLNTDLKVIEPFSEGLVSDVSGQAEGTVQVTGSLGHPILQGEVTVDKGRLKFDYLQSVLTFNDKIYFSESEIATRNMIVTDQDGNTATLRGGVYHEGFRYFSLGFNADLRNFKILNTNAADNDLFYGTAYVTGKASLFGPLDNLTIEANVTSNRGTRIYIPLDGATEVATQDYIQFVSQLPKEDSTNAGQGASSSLDMGGIKMDFNFNITPDAYCEIQLDRQAGDIIKAYGSGLLNMKIDTKGDFEMSGTYEIARGDYTFTFQNALNKKFEIKPGSRITWSGDPYAAILDVQAGYTQLASLAGVLPGITTNSNNATNPLSRRYPVEVTITLTDRLMSPQIAYDMRIVEYPASGEYRSAVAAFENRLRSDEQELSRQVSSLILFNQLLTPQDALLAQTNQSQSFIGNSISELVTNQVSKWASALNENLEVGLTGLSLDQNALNNLQLRFSYRFLNDRFRVTRDGRFNYGIIQHDAASLVGEWTLEYWLTQTGSVRLKAYNRNIQNPLLLSNTLTTGGVSMQFTHSFNRFVIPKTHLAVPAMTPAKPDSTDTDDADSSGKLTSSALAPDSTKK